jgi:hypothetical protein
MKIKIEIDCSDAALHDDLENELTRILSTIPEKISLQLERDGRCVCEALESTDKLLDINGNTVDRVRIIQENGKLFTGQCISYSLNLRKITVIDNNEKMLRSSLEKLARK